MDIGIIRKEYSPSSIEIEDLKKNPIEQFESWFREACENIKEEPNAMSLATVSDQGIPSQRTVLLKYFDQQGLVFFTNYSSTKARHIEQSPFVSLLFLWVPLERQVQIVGKASKISTTESLKYFATRPRGSQLGSWCSHQSRVISNRKMLELKLHEIHNKFRNHQIPLPSFWGGYRVVPQSFEFWNGRPNRLHDRFFYKRETENDWSIHRLSP